MICQLSIKILPLSYRNVMNWKDANTTEIEPDTPYPVVIDMPEHNPGQMGGTMRLGKRTTVFHGDSILSTKLQLSNLYIPVTERLCHRKVVW